MDKDFSELVEYLDQKFVKIDERFNDVDERFVKIDEKFVKIDERFNDVNEQLRELRENKADKSDIHELMDAIDAYARKADTYFQEMVMLAHKVDRLEKWIQQIAEKIGMKLES